MNPSPKRKPLSNSDALKGAANGRATRVGDADEWAWSVCKAATELNDQLEVRIRGLTNKEIAEHLSRPPFKLRAPRGGPLTDKLVHKAFNRMGIDRSAIKRWRKKAIDAADKWGLSDPLVMIFQLNTEWRWFEATNFDLFRRPLGDDPPLFVYRPVHPKDWVPPDVREIVGPFGPRQPSKIPATFWISVRPHLAGILMSRLDVDGKDAAAQALRQRQEDERRSEAEARGESYEGHWDDPTDLGRYLLGGRAPDFR